MSAEERHVVKHFNENDTRDIDGRFIVPLLKKPEAGVLGESRSTAVKRSLSIYGTLTARKWAVQQFL